jgi:hypothetical protein
MSECRDTQRRGIELRKFTVVFVSPDGVQIEETDIEAIGIIRAAAVARFDRKPGWTIDRIQEAGDPGYWKLGSDRVWMDSR